MPNEPWNEYSSCTTAYFSYEALVECRTCHTRMNLSVTCRDDEYHPLCGRCYNDFISTRHLINDIDEEKLNLLNVDDLIKLLKV